MIEVTPEVSTPFGEVAEGKIKSYVALYITADVPPNFFRDQRQAIAHAEAQGADAHEIVVMVNGKKVYLEFSDFE